ncbi:hypothetical protein ACRALDRAFT_1040368, partial [Sodiomyces alcalophilus JCM 7366]|uniref:uncharacterized protein n=1 Tax=Sodiomyces alcalophilus JCM 7366 TaxID=591952 RepID=UPI0039B3CAFE
LFPFPFFLFPFPSDLLSISLFLFVSLHVNFWRAAALRPTWPARDQPTPEGQGHDKQHRVESKRRRRGSPPSRSILLRFAFPNLITFSRYQTTTTTHFSVRPSQSFSLFFSFAHDRLTLIPNRKPALCRGFVIFIQYYLVEYSYTRYYTLVFCRSLSAPNIRPTEDRETIRDNQQSNKNPDYDEARFRKNRWSCYLPPRPRLTRVSILFVSNSSRSFFSCVPTANPFTADSSSARSFHSPCPSFPHRAPQDDTYDRSWISGGPLVA